MHLSVESVIVIYLVGIATGLLAGQVMNGTGFGLVGDLPIGIIGAFIGGGLMPQIGLHFGAGVFAAIIDATTGAIVLLFVIRLVRGGGRWNGDWVTGGGNGWRRRWR